MLKGTGNLLICFWFENIFGKDEVQIDANCGCLFCKLIFLKVGWLQVCSKIVNNILHALTDGQARANFPFLIAMFRL